MYFSQIIIQFTLFISTIHTEQYEYEPEIISIENNSVKLKIFPLPKSFNYKIESYYVMVEELKEEKQEWNTNISSKSIANMSLVMNISVSSLVDDGIDIVISRKTFYLKNGHQYRFVLAALLTNGTNYYLPSSRSIIIPSGKIESLNIAWIVISTIFLILVIIITVYIYLKFKDNFYQDAFIIWTKKSQPTSFLLGYKKNNKEGFFETPIEQNNPIMVKSFKVPSIETINYEFNLIPRGNLFSCDAAKNKINMFKNRYIDIIPYDYNRVRINGKYINASKIDNYIITQGPLPNTIGDFWEMVTTQEAKVIVMLTDLIENGKVKCEKYWPETCLLVDNLTITLTAQKICQHFIIRKFKIQQKNSLKSQNINQYHFTSWPDHASPSSPDSILSLLAHLIIYNDTIESPLIVHCSAGMGRSGTFILIHYIINRLISGNHSIDILNGLYKFRMARVNLIENIEQYHFIYKTIEYFIINSQTQWIDYLNSFKN